METKIISLEIAKLIYKKECKLCKPNIHYLEKRLF